MQHRTPTLPLALLCAALLSLPTSAQDKTMKSTAAKGAGTLLAEETIHMQATVTAVDQKARTVTLKGPEGNELTFNVSDEVKRLNEVKVGDVLDIGYLQAVGLELRPATSEELKDPLKVVEESDRSDKSRAPATAQLRAFRAVVTLEGMDRWTEDITVRGPRGNYYVLDVDPGSIKWEDLRIGQTLVATYTEAMVLSLEHRK